MRSDEPTEATGEARRSDQTVRALSILILGINHSPEQVGIGPYTAEMAAWLASRGHSVAMVTAKPYYPAWRSFDAFRGGGYHRSVEDGVEIVRCPIYVPARPSGAKRIAHHLSFAAVARRPIERLARERKPDIIVAIAPSLVAAPVARSVARRHNAASWLHIQDFEVEAAFVTGLIDERSALGRVARTVEGAAMDGFDRYSSISPQMCARLLARGIPADRVVEFRNWSDVERLTPTAGLSPYRAELGIETPHVALYSGNIANKQGIGLVIDAARLLRARRDLTFLVCGEGPNRDALIASAADLTNVRFIPLQPRDRLRDLLGLASVHLLPQLAGAADLVLPSKLTNMLASGRPVVATAARGTGLADEVEGCGIVTEPGDAQAFAAAIVELLDDPERRDALGREARARAEQRWAKNAILTRVEGELLRLAAAR